MNKNTIKDILDYNKNTGLFVWKNINKYARSRKKGDVAGSVDSHGYISIQINNKGYRAHRLAWIYTHGDIPENMEIDHINGIRDDNRIKNLRLATRLQNSFNMTKYANNTSGYKGVDYHKKLKKYKAQCRYNKKIKHLGWFDTAEEASDAYIEFTKKIHGEFFRV